MSVSGNQETGVYARYSSISSAGVPIKKRRFPMFRPNSPPQEETSPPPEQKPSSPAQKDAGLNRQSSPSQESSLLNTSVVTSSAAQSDTSKNGFLEIKKESSSETNSSSVTSVQENLNLSKARVQEPNVAFDSSLPDNIDSKEKVIMLTNKSAQDNNQLQTELHLTPTEAPAVRIRKEAVNKHDLGTDFKLRLSNISEGSILSSGLKESSALAGQKTDGSHRMPDKLDSASLSLSLSKGECSSSLVSDHPTARKEDMPVRSNRSNWDLNTTMDAWEGSVGEAAIPRTVLFSGLNEMGGAHAIKSSASMCEVGDVRGKHIVEAGEHSSSLPISSSSSQQYKSEDSLSLSLSTTFRQPNVRAEDSGLSAKIDSRSLLPNSNAPGVLVSTGNRNAIGRPTVKSEPRDDSAKHDHVGASGRPAKPDHAGDRGHPAGILDPRTVKMEIAERCNTGVDNLSTINPRTVVEPKSIKSEPVQDGNRGTHRTVEPMSLKLIGLSVSQENASSSTAMHSQARNSCASGELVMQADISVSGKATNVELATSTVHKDHQLNTDISQEESGNVVQAPVEKVSAFQNQEDRESNADVGTSNACMVEYTHVDGPETRNMTVMEEAPQDSRGRGEAGSEDEKVNISNDILEEDSYDSDFESGSEKAVVAPTDIHQRKYGKEDDEYEDGEVRDPLVQTAAQGSTDEEAINVTIGNCNNEDSNSFGFRSDDNIASAPTDEKDSKEEDCGEMNDALMKERANTFPNLKSRQVVDEDSSLRESVSGEMLTVGPDGRMPSNAVCALDECIRSDLEMGCDTETLSDGANNEGQGTEMTVFQAADENMKGTGAMDGNGSTFPRTEAPMNVNETAKDSNTGGNRSRIIHLPRATNATTPYKTRCYQERSFGRERYADFDGEKMHPPRNRDEIYTDGPRKFLRDRYQGQSFRNSRQNYGRGRGRAYGRTDSSRTDWDSDRIFIPRSYNDQTDFRFPRHKRNSAVGDEELECNGYLMDPDGDLVGSGRGGRKPVGDELPSFRHPSSRRLSPGARDGPAARGIQVLRRIPRNISPSRCTGEDGSELAGLRHGDKFMRGVSDDIIDPIFTRAQPPYEGLDRQFVRGNRNFPSGQRRGGGPRVRSKSPIRSRTRSPGPWSSPRRRSPDGFNGVSEYNQRRSPVMYRKERIRSPDLPCSPDEMVDRRRGSPSFMTRPSNDARDMDSGRVHGHTRSIIPNRSPSDRVIPRSARRFDVHDPRERTDSDEYFGGPRLRSSRFHELGGDGNADDRRKFGERRAIVRPPFRASGGGADNENFRCHPEDGPPRSFRLSPEADSEFIERINAREREFDRRIKNRPVIAPRRIEQEGNYRQGGQVWHEEGFEDGSRTKRRRF